MNYSISSPTAYNYSKHKQIKEVNGMFSLTLEKLQNIRDLARNDLEWKSWDFVKFTEALRPWTRGNPMDNFKTEESHTHRKREKPNRSILEVRLL